MIKRILPFVLSCLLSATESNRITSPPVAGTPKAAGWTVDPGRGELSVSIPVGVVPGEIPIPVGFTMNGTFLSYCTGFLGAGNALVTFWRDFAVHGTLGFGYVGWGRQNGVEGNRVVVLEDGRSYPQSEFSAYPPSSPYGRYGSGLLEAFGASGTPADLRISADGTLAWATIPVSQFQASYSSSVREALPFNYGNVEKIDIIMDKDRIRIYAEVEARCPDYLPAEYPKGRSEHSKVSLPIQWRDRQGHWVTFRWAQFAGAGMPHGISSMVRVDVLNQRDQGVTVRYANWADNTRPVDLLRADFVGCPGPSVCMSGYSGTASAPPEGFANPFGRTAAQHPRPIYLAGIVARPTTITLGDPRELPQPSWSNTGCFPSRSPGLPPAVPHGEAQVWSLEYDGAGAALLGLTTPGKVHTRFACGKTDSIFQGPGTLPTLIQGVTAAREEDQSGHGNSLHSVTWDRLFPKPDGSAWAQKDWIVTRREAWGPEGSLDRTEELTYVSPATNLLDYRNRVLQSSVLKSGGEIMETTRTETMTTGDKGGGLDGSLSLPRSILTQRKGENDRRLDFSYGDPTCLQVTTRATRAQSGGGLHGFQYEAFEYNDQWPVLEGGQVNRVETTRLDASRVLSPVDVVRHEWDPGRLLQLKKTWRAGGRGEHGQVYSYDSEGRVQTEDVWHVENGEGVPSPATLTTQYDPASGQPARWSTRFQDGEGGAGTSTRAVEAFDGAGRPAAQVDERGVRTRRDYDLFGRLVHEEVQGLLPVDRSYPDPWTFIETQGGRVATARKDGFGRLIAEEKPEGFRLEYAYGADGLLAATTRIGSQGTTAVRTVRHDPLGRPVFEKDFDGTVTTYAYEAAPEGCNQVTRSFDGSNPTITLTDPLGRVAQVSYPTGDIVQKRYDGFGNLSRVETSSAKDGARQVRRYTFDLLGRRTGSVEPETGTRRVLAFDALSLPVKIQESPTRTRTQVFDGLGRLRSRSSSEGGQTLTERFTYSGANLVDTARSFAGETVAQHFDYLPPEAGARLGKETVSQRGLTASVGYAYSGLGALEVLTYPSGRGVTYGFDPIGRPTSITTGLGASTQVLVPVPAESPFDEWGNRKALLFQSGARDLWAGDATHARPGTAQILPKAGDPMGWTYGYDATTGWLTGTGEWVLKLDPLGRLLQATGTASAGSALSQGSGFDLTLAHDAFGNNTQATPSASQGLQGGFNAFSFGSSLVDNHLPESIGAAYNACGEILRMPLSAGSKPFLNLDWDPTGRLAAVGQSVGGSSQAYRYTVSGHRVARLDGQDAARTRFYAYASGGRLLTEFLGGAQWGRDVVYLEGRAVLEIDANGVHELHGDHLGTPRIITLGATGAVEGGQSFAPYGERLGQWGYLPLTGFTGHLQEEANGLIYMKGRFYSPVWHRFVNSDQGGDPNSLNQYAYCNGRPMVLRDPSGMIGAGLNWEIPQSNKDAISVLQPFAQAAIGMSGDVLILGWDWQGGGIIGTPHSVGHIAAAIQGREGGWTIVQSQFPHGPGEESAIRGPNVTISNPPQLFDAEGGRIPDFAFVVNVPNLGSYAQAAIRDLKIHSWAFFPQVYPGTTNCTYGVINSLRAGGVAIPAIWANMSLIVPVAPYLPRDLKGALMRESKFNIIHEYKIRQNDNLIKSFDWGR